MNYDKVKTLGMLALCLLCSVFSLQNAQAATNPAGNTITSMNASDNDYGVIGSALHDRILNNYGNILGGESYTIGSTNYLAGMFGQSVGSVDYVFTNTGSIDISNTGNYISGMLATSDFGNHILSNSGNINVSGNNYIFGISASTNMNGDHTINNSGHIDVSGNTSVYGIYATVTDGAQTLINSNSIVVDGSSGVYAMSATAETGGHTLTNSGHIAASATGSYAYGMQAYNNLSGDHKFYNYGDINVSGNGTVNGMFASALDGNHELSNSGSIDVKGDSGIHGMHAEARNDGGHTLTNSASITVHGTGNGVHGMYAYSTDFGDHTFYNSGTINVSGTATVSGMNAFAIGSHRLSNSGIINVSGTDNIFGMTVSGGSRSDIILVNNTGSITAKATSGQASEVYVSGNYSVGTWATTLRTWNANDAVFAGYNNINLTFANSTLILRPGTAAQGFVWGQEYAIAGANGMAAGVSSVGGTVTGTITEAITEVPFLKATLTNGHDPSTATVRLDANVNDETTPGNGSAQQGITVVQGQMSNIARKLLQTKYNEVYVNTASETGHSAGSASDNNHWTVFLNPYFNFVDNAKYNFDGESMGITGGATYHANDRFSLGVHFDFNSSNYDADIMHMESSATSFALGLHASYNIMPKWYVSLQTTGAFSQTDNNYSVNTSSLLSAENKYNSEALYLALTTGYVFKLSENFSIMPEIGLSYLTMHSDAYDIKWSSPSMAMPLYDMSYDDMYYSNLFGNINLNTRGEWALVNDSTLALNIGLGLRQNLTSNNMETSFSALGNSYTARTREDNTTFITDIGVAYTIGAVSIGLNYNGDYGYHQTVHGGEVVFTFDF